MAKRTTKRRKTKGPKARSDDLTPSVSRARQVRGGGERMQASRPLHCDVRRRIDADRHSTIRSARSANDGGIVRPMALAVLLLIANSNVVGCSTGRSPGFAPFKILST